MQTSCDCAILYQALIQLMSAALSGFNLGTVLLASIVLFPLACLFFGTQGGYYNTDKYDGNGTAH